MRQISILTTIFLSFCLFAIPVLADETATTAEGPASPSVQPEVPALSEGSLPGDDGSSQLSSGSLEPVDGATLSQPTTGGGQQDALGEVLEEIDIGNFEPAYSEGFVGETLATDGGEGTLLNAAQDGLRQFDPEPNIRVERININEVRSSGNLATSLTFSVTLLTDNTQTAQFTATSWQWRDEGYIIRRWQRDPTNPGGPERLISTYESRHSILYLRNGSQDLVTIEPQYGSPPAPGQRPPILYYNIIVASGNPALTPAMRNNGFRFERVINGIRYDVRDLVAVFINGRLRFRQRGPLGPGSGPVIYP